MKIIDTYNNIEKRIVLDCRVKSYYELVRHYGIELDSLEIFLLSELLDFTFCKIDIPEIGLEDAPFGGCSVFGADQIFFSNIGLDLHTFQPGGDEEGMDILRDLIDHDTPVLFRLDSRFENEDAPINADRLNFYNPSTLLLVGYDDEYVYVVFNTTWQKHELYKMTISHFQKYRSGYCIPYPPDNICYTISPTEEDVRRIKSEREKLCLEVMHKTAERMLAEHITPSHTDGAIIEKEMSKGVYGMKRMSSFLKELAGSSESDTIIKLSLMMLRLNMVQGSRSGYRNEFAASMEFVGNRYGIPEISELSGILKKRAGFWRDFVRDLDYIARNDVSDREKLMNDTILITEAMEKTISTEEAVYSGLIEITSDKLGRVPVR